VIQRRRQLLVAYALLGMNYVTTLSVLHRFQDQRVVRLVLASLNGALLLAVFVLYVSAVYRTRTTLPSDGTPFRLRMKSR
jgi:hypothetical protein